MNSDSSDDDNDDVEVAVQASAEIDAVDLGISKDKGDAKRKCCGRSPHCEDGRFEENARNVLDAHVDVEYDVDQLFQDLESK